MNLPVLKFLKKIRAKSSFFKLSKKNQLSFLFIFLLLALLLLGLILNKKRREIISQFQFIPETPPITPPLTPTPPSCILADIDCSGKVNSLDFHYIIIDYNTNNPRADLDGSGQVDIYDTLILLADYGKIP